MMLNVFCRPSIGRLNLCFVVLSDYTQATELPRFANDQSLHQFYKVLASGGSLGLIWNIEDCA